MRNSCLALLLGAILAGSSSAQGWAEKMFKESLTHDFGTVARGTQMSRRFTLTNIYAVRMEITSIKSGCGCVTATAEKRILEPRESTTIEVRMDGSRFAGPKTVGVRISVGPEFISSAEIKVTANSRSDIVFNPGEVSFGAVARGQTPTQFIDVEYAGRLPWQVSEVIARDVPYTATVKETYRRPGQVGYRLFVTMKNDAPAGTLKHTLFLKTNDPTTPLVPVLVEASVQAPVSVVPDTLNLGVVKTDAAHLRRVVVKASQPCKIVKVDGLGTGIELDSPLSPRLETVHFLGFKCNFGTAGNVRRELKIYTSAQDSPVTVILHAAVTK